MTTTVPSSGFAEPLRPDARRARAQAADHRWRRQSQADHAAFARATASARSVTPPIVRWITVADIYAALRAGIEDFLAAPLYGLLFGAAYGAAGLALVAVALRTGYLALIFPMAAGFALVAPLIEVGLYELSRRREQGLPVRWWHAFGVRRHLSLRAFVALCGLLTALYAAWLATAVGLYTTMIGEPPADIGDFLRQLLTTEPGWTLIVVGNAIGAVFALAAFLMSAVSFPLLMDRQIGPRAAVATSVSAVLANPLAMGLWALISAAGVMLGSVSLLLGLPRILPVLGHAAWHIYRRVVLA